mmetsp:Transcript_25003/g.44460  ORF Transcript_25003/g.44460 Transcript_25003/m.44460 type:complete len:204 (-) Transcript_25003:248-859(-)
MCGGRQPIGSFFFLFSLTRLTISRPQPPSLNRLLTLSSLSSSFIRKNSRRMCLRLSRKSTARPLVSFSTAHCHLRIGTRRTGRLYRIMSVALERERMAQSLSSFSLSSFNSKSATFFLRSLTDCCASASLFCTLSSLCSSGDSAFTSEADEFEASGFGILELSPVPILVSSPVSVSVSFRSFAFAFAFWFANSAEAAAAALIS